MKQYARRAWVSIEVEDDATDEDVLWAWIRVEDRINNGNDIDVLGCAVGLEPEPRIGEGVD